MADATQWMIVVEDANDNSMSPPEFARNFADARAIQARMAEDTASEYAVVIYEMQQVSARIGDMDES